MKAPRTVRALNMMAILIAGFLLTTHHPTFAQNLDNAIVLTQQAIELTKQKRNALLQLTKKLWAPITSLSRFR
jgi:hypothetical protein